MAYEIFAANTMKPVAELAVTKMASTTPDALDQETITP